MKKYPFYNFSSFHEEPDKEDELALKFVSNTSMPLFDPHFDEAFGVRHFPNMDSVFLTPKEHFNSTIYFPTSVEGKIVFEGVEDLSPGGSFEISSYKKIEIIQKDPYYSEGLEGIPMPILWVFEGAKEVFAKVAMTSYFPLKEKGKADSPGEPLSPLERMWKLPAYDFRHPAALKYIKPLLWNFFSKDEVKHFSAPTPNSIWDIDDENFYCKGIFYPIDFLRDGKGWARFHNYTAEPVTFHWHGPEDSGFGDDESKSFTLGGFEKADVDITIPRKTPQVIVAMGASRIEWFPLYFYEYLDD